jgi:hypothetical protein
MTVITLTDFTEHIVSAVAGCQSCLCTSARCVHSSCCQPGPDWHQCPHILSWHGAAWQQHRHSTATLFAPISVAESSTIHWHLRVTKCVGCTTTVSSRPHSVRCKCRRMACSLVVKYILASHEASVLYTISLDTGRSQQTILYMSTYPPSVQQSPCSPTTEKAGHAPHRLTTASAL